MAVPNSSSRFTDAEPPGPPLIGALLRFPWESVQAHMLRRLNEQGFDDLDAAHLNVFRYPGPQGARPSELAAELGVSKQALNYLLGELERSGYLERHAHPDDQRSKRIALTDRGTAVVHAIRDAVREVEATWAERLGAERFAELRTLLEELNEVA